MEINSRTIAFQKQLQAFLFSILLFFLIFSSFGNHYVYANDGANMDIEVVFVIDTSYSMNDNDKEKIAIEVMNMFMDMSHSLDTRIGFVVYNDKIVASQQLTSIATIEQKNYLKQKLKTLPRSGYTDLGLGLKKGQALFSDNKGQATKRLMILLTDGEIDLGNHPSKRTFKQSEQDIEDVVSQAQQEGYPIYTVGLNRDGSVNKTRLEQIALETGGSSFITQNADALPEIFNNIFASHIQSILIPVAAVTANGQLQEVEINIPNSSMDELNLILLSKNPVSESHLYYSSKDVQFFTSNKYSLMKIIEPKKEKLLLKFKGKQGDLVKINLLGNYHLHAELEMSDITKGQLATIVARLVQPEHRETIEDNDVYSELQAELIVRSKDNNVEELRLPMDYIGNGFEINHTFSKSGVYDVSVLMSGSTFYRETAMKTLELVNNPPEATVVKPIVLNKEKGETIIDLNEYFSDPNRDKLHYEISSYNDERTVTARIDEHRLVLSPLQAGRTTITITAADGEGAAVSSELSLTTDTIWSRNQLPLITLGIIILFAIVAFFLFKPKKKFFGRMEGYFLNTASGNDIPVMYWPLTSFENRDRISLKDLFVSLDVDEVLPEAEQIFFHPGKNNTLLVKHHTGCTVVIGREPVPKNKKATLQYNDKLYITFEDGLTEIELRYKKLKPNYQ